MTSFSSSLMKKREPSNSKDIPVHILGILLVLSTLYHSMDLYSLVLGIPVFLVSFGAHKEMDRMKMLGLFGATIYPPFVIVAGSMEEAVPILLYLVTFIIPLVLYWALVLASDIDMMIEWKGIGICASYVISVLLLFYLIPLLLGVSEFILSPENRVGQALLIVGFALLMAIPYLIILELKSPAS